MMIDAVVSSLGRGARRVVGSLCLLVFTAALASAQYSPGGVGASPYGNGSPGFGTGYGGGGGDSTIPSPGLPSDTGGSNDVINDPPTANSLMPEPPADEAPSPFMNALKAASWYLPNRLLDLSDIPSAYITMGDGLGLSLRATKAMNATWFVDSAYCLGWTKRTPPWFGEQIHEQYFGFLAAQAGELDRDPTEVGLSLHFLLIGFNVAVSGGEAIDALAGFAGVDLAGDDHGPVWIDDLESDPAKVRAQRILYGPSEPGEVVEYQAPDDPAATPPTERRAAPAPAAAPAP